MKFLIDMNLSPRWAAFLVEAGFEAVHWSKIGSGDAPDVELMLWALANDHVLVTSDLDFGAILAATRNRRPSVLLFRGSALTPETIGRAALSAINKTQGELREGAVLALDAERSRLRILPLAGR